MAKEYPASKAQLAKAAELGIDTSGRPGYTTLGALLEAAGWAKDGKSPLGDGPLVATGHLDSLASRKTEYQLRQERKARGPWWQQPHTNDTPIEEPNFTLDERGSQNAAYEPAEG